MTTSTNAYVEPTIAAPNPRGEAAYKAPMATYSLSAFAIGYHKAGEAPTSATRLADNTYPLALGLLIKADDDNTGSIYVRCDPDASELTADSGASTSGFRLLKGQSVNLPINDPFKVWIIASAASQDYVAIGAKG